MNIPFFMSLQEDALSAKLLPGAIVRRGDIQMDSLKSDVWDSLTKTRCLESTFEYQKSQILIACWVFPQTLIVYIPVSF